MALVYPYPPGTPGSESKDSYYHKLSPANVAALGTLQQWVVTSKIDIKDLCLDCIHPDLILLRYLRAFKFKPDKAIAAMTKNIQFRKEHHVRNILDKNPEEILGVKLEKLTTIFPHWHSGYDKTGRPVLYKVYGGFDAKKIKTMLNGSFDNLVNYHVWEQEMCTKLCLQQSHKLGQIVETCTAIMDVKDMVMSQISRSFLGLTKQMAAIDQDQYPETLGRIIVINAPSAFPMAWRMVKGFLDPVVTAKITVCGGPSEWEPILFDLIGKENLPSNYGGYAPALSHAVHPYAEAMTSSGYQVTFKETCLTEVPSTSTLSASSSSSPSNDTSFISSTKTDVETEEEEEDDSEDGVLLLDTSTEISDLKLVDTNEGDSDISFVSVTENQRPPLLESPCPASTSA